MPKGTRVRKPASKAQSGAKGKGKGRAKDALLDEAIESFDEDYVEESTRMTFDDDITELVTPAAQETWPPRRSASKRAAPAVRTAPVVTPPSPAPAEAPAPSMPMVSLDPDQLILADFTKWRDDVCLLIYG